MFAFFFTPFFFFEFFFRFFFIYFLFFLIILYTTFIKSATLFLNFFVGKSTKVLCCFLSILPYGFTRSNILEIL